jgi:UPF0755 protein
MTPGRSPEEREAARLERERRRAVREGRTPPDSLPAWTEPSDDGAPDGSSAGAASEADVPATAYEPGEEGTLNGSSDGPPMEGAQAREQGPRGDGAEDTVGDGVAPADGAPATERGPSENDDGADGVGSSADDLAEGDGPAAPAPSTSPAAEAPAIDDTSHVPFTSPEAQMTGPVGAGYASFAPPADEAPAAGPAGAGEQPPPADQSPAAAEEPADDNLLPPDPDDDDPDHAQSTEAWDTLHDRPVDEHDDAGIGEKDEDAWRDDHEIVAPVRRPAPKTPAPSSSARPRTSSRRRFRIRLLVVIALIAVLTVLVLLFTLFQPGKGSGHEAVAVRIPQGSGANQIGDLLAKRGVVDSSFMFGVRVALAGKRDALRSGTLVFKKDSSYSTAIDVLTTKPKAAPVVAFTLPEGQSIKESAAKLRAAGLRGSYIDATRRPPPAALRAPEATRTLEGLMFPSTYQLKKTQGAKDLVAKQLAAFQQNMGQVDLAAAKKKNLSPYDVVIIASMVEREVQVAKERPVVAGIIYNRLRDSMPLGIDATTRYALGNFTQPLKDSDFPRSGRYNTRRNLGLPPTPIGNPGLASLKAAANPARTPYLYYVVKPGSCGEHAFEKSFAEFQAASQKYSQARDAAGGKSPTKC